MHNKPADSSTEKIPSRSRVLWRLAGLTAGFVVLFPVLCVSVAPIEVFHSLSPLTQEAKRAFGFDVTSTKKESRLDLAPTLPAANARRSTFVGEVDSAIENEDNLIEVCGVGKLDITKNKLAPVDSFSPPLAGVFAILADKYSASASEKDRVLGMQLSVIAAEASKQEEFLSQYPGCSRDTECAVKRPNRYFETNNPAADPLARYALNTRDPDVYAAAVYQCKLSMTSACRAITLEGWAAIDPDNAVPWLLVAGRDSRRSNLVQRDQAMARAIAATKYIQRAPSFGLAAGDDLVKMLPPFAHTAVINSLWLERIMIDIAMSYSPIIQFCKKDLMDLPGRREGCDNLAHKFVEDDNSLIGFSIGTVIGERAGWSIERVTALKAEREALTSLSLGVSFATDMFSCEGLASRSKLHSSMLEIGERLTLQNAIKARAFALRSDMKP